MMKPSLLVVATLALSSSAGPVAGQRVGDSGPQATVVETLTGEIPGGTGGISVAPDGTVYVADFGETLTEGPPGTRVFAVTPEGEVRVHAEGLRGASGNELGPGGVLYQSNIAGRTLSRILPDGTVEGVAEGLRAPVGVAMDGAGDLLVAECGAGAVRRVKPDGRTEVFAADTALLRCPNGITLDDAGDVYVANFGNGDVVRIGSDGRASRLVTLPGDNNGHLTFHDGSLWVVARGAHRIYRVDLDGGYELVAGSGEQGLDDGPALEATFSFPNDIGVSPDGRYLYVNDVADLSSDGRLLAPMVVRRITLETRGSGG